MPGQERQRFPTSRVRSMDTLGIASLPDHVLGCVFSHLGSPADRMSLLLVCKRFLSAAVAHSLGWWESLRVSANKGDRQKSFWVAHHQHVRSLAVANSTMGGHPGVFLLQILKLTGLPALKTLKVEAPVSGDLRAIYALSTLRHLHLNLDDQRGSRRLGRGILRRMMKVPLPIAPGALHSLRSLDLNFHLTCMVEVSPGALRSLGSLTRLHISAELVRPSSSGPGRTIPFGLGWADLEGTTALRQLHWDVNRSGQMSLSESQALSLLGRLEELSVSPAECSSQGFLAALPRLAALTRVDLAFQNTHPMPSPAPMQAATACPNLKALSTNWLPSIQLLPSQLSSLTWLRLHFGAYRSFPDPAPSWFSAMPALEALELLGRRLPAGLEALPSLKSLHFQHPLWGQEDALERLSLLLHLTSLELVGFVKWSLLPGPYLSNLRSLVVRWVRAVPPIPPALAGAQCLASLKLFMGVAPPSLPGSGNSLAPLGSHVSVPLAHWADADVALLRALPSLERLELVDFDTRVLQGNWNGGMGPPLAPGWRQSAETLAAQLPGVAVTARKVTREEAQPKFP